jgi:ATP-dependent RNA helicase DBP3
MIGQFWPLAMCNYSIRFPRILAQKHMAAVQMSDKKVKKIKKSVKEGSDKTDIVPSETANVVSVTESKISKKDKKDKKEKKRKRSDDDRKAVDQSPSKAAKVSDEKKDKKKNKKNKNKDDKENKPEAQTKVVPQAEDRSVQNSKKYSNEEVQKFLQDNEITITTKKQLQPCLSFSDFPAKMPEFCKGFTKPSPIQASSWPYVLNGQDVIGIAETG